MAATFDKISITTEAPDSNGETGFYTIGCIVAGSEPPFFGSSERDLKAYEAAEDVQTEVEDWIRRMLSSPKGNLKPKDVRGIETGIRLQEKRCVIYIPEAKKEEILAQLEKDIECFGDAMINYKQG